MILRPFNEVEEPQVIKKSSSPSPVVFTDVLEAAGISERATLVEKEDESKIARVRRMFDEEGASLQESAKVLGRLMRTSDKDAVRFNSAKVVAQIHGALQDLEGAQIPVVNISVQGNGENTILNLVTPRV